MNLLVDHALVLDVAPDHLFVRILSNRVHVVAARPEIATPEHLFDLRVGLKDMFGCEAFRDLCNLCWGENRSALDEEMDVIKIRPNLYEPKFVALLNFQTDLFQCLFHWFCQSFFPVLHRTHQVVEQKRPVVAFGDVLTHPMMVHLKEP